MLFTKRSIVICTFVFIFVAGVMVSKSLSQVGGGWTNIDFSTHKYSLKFFDRDSGKIYSYSESDGKVIEVWILEELGKDLRKIYPAKDSYKR